jgi:hypothetical protein
MKREEAVKLVKEVTGMSLDWDDAHYEALQMAIKALEQEPAIDKIRAEIKQMDFDFGDFYDHTDRIREMVLEVINKYRAESEE